MMTGTVEAIQTKDVTTKFGVKPTWSIRVAGKWIKCGFKNPNVEAGYTVDFDAIQGTYGLETKAVNIVARGGVAPAPAATAPMPVATSAAAIAPSAPAKTYTPYKEKVFPIPPLHGDRAIIRQNALARATDIYIAARGGKPFELEGATLDLVISFARKFEAYTAGDLDLAEAMAEEASATPSSEDSPLS
jgi:hypothetical protein